MYNDEVGVMMSPMTSYHVWEILALTIAFIPIIYSLVYLWILPMNRIRTLEDNVGFAHIRGKRKKEAINRLRYTRNAGKIPPPLPNGWYAVAESREVRIIKTGQANL